MSKKIQINVNSLANLEYVIKRMNEELEGKNINSIMYNKTGLLKGVITVSLDDPTIVKVPVPFTVEKEVIKEVLVPHHTETIREIYKGEHVKIVNQVKKQPGITSQYWGVYKRGNSWVAMTSHKGERKWIGTFRYELDAAEAYDKEAFLLRGKKATLNFPESYRKG